MEKTELMLEYERETRETLDMSILMEDASGSWYGFLDMMNEKASAYDRLMSWGKKTLKEIANIFGSIVAMDESGRLHLFGMEPKINKNVGEWQPVYRSYYEKVPICDIDFNGDWKNSLTLPDGWEEK